MLPRLPCITLSYPESMDRVRGVGPSEAGWIAKFIYRALKKKIGSIPKSKTLVAHHTPTLLASSWMDVINASARTVPLVLKELAQLKVALMAGCPFWIDLHSAVGRRAGITEAQLHDISRFEESAAFTAPEKLVLRLAAAMTRTPAHIDDDLFAALRAAFTEPQLVELSTAIAWENHRARFNRVFGVEAEGFSQGAFCPLPERQEQGAWI
jgi:AhpD family alkylhydroperoxidase